MPSSETPLQPSEPVAPAIPVVETPPDEADALAQTQQAIATAALSFSIKVLTVNIHKGFTFFNRKFILHELREAVRTVGADVVFLQEVTGTHARHESRVANYPATPHYEFLADTIWPQFAYGRNAVYTNGHHGNAVLSKFPIVHFENRDVSISGPERRGLLHCVLEVPGRDTHVHAICVHLGLAESHRLKQLHMLCDMVLKDIPASAPVIAAESPGMPLEKPAAEAPLIFVEATRNPAWNSGLPEFMAAGLDTAAALSRVQSSAAFKVLVTRAWGKRCVRTPGVAVTALSPEK